jgi:transposase, IS30 family
MSHITLEQRYTISTMLKKGYTQQAIALMIEKDKSIVSREIRRNMDLRSGEYRYVLAQKKYTQRMVNKPKAVLFTHEVEDYVKGNLEKDYSPEQIVGTAKKNGIVCVSHERIYQYIWKDKKQGGGLYLHLRTEGKRYQKRGNGKERRGSITGRVDISERPPAVDKRDRLGDLEIDTIIGKNHQGAIITINDRATGLLKMIKVKTRKADLVAKKTIKALKKWKPILKTMTSDNGKEFALHQKIKEKLEIDFYFAKPYHSWERGSNENLNGLIRQYIPKKTDFNLISHQYVKYIEEKLNNRPRKRFGFNTPLYQFNQLIKSQEKVAFVA